MENVSDLYSKEDSAPKLTGQQLTFVFSATPIQRSFNWMTLQAAETNEGLPNENCQDTSGAVSLLAKNGLESSR